MIVTSDEMMNTAIEMFVRHGYGNVSVGQICKECGVTRGSFYNYFDSKEKLLERWVEELIGDVESSFVCTPDKSALDNLHDELMLWANKLAQIAPELLREYTVAVNNSFADYKLHVNYSVVRELLLQAQKDGDISTKHTPEELVSVYSAGVAGLSLWRNKDSSTEEFLSAIALLFEVVFGKK